jgi:hypothetical protein
MQGNISSAVFLANAYVDLGTWWCFTPFIGAGIGGARNMISGVQDLGLNPAGAPGFGFTTNDSAQWNLAWDVQAGLTYNVTDNFKVDLSWRFLNLGSPQTAFIHCQNTPNCPGALLHAARLHLAGFPPRRALVVPSWRRFGFGGFAQPAFAPAAGQCRLRNTCLHHPRNMCRLRRGNTCRNRL